jgi:site-specific recombinase XerD
VKQLFNSISKVMDRTIFLLMLRCGLRGLRDAHLKLTDIDRQQSAVLIEQGKGRKDRWLYLSADALLSWRECLRQRPQGINYPYFFWNQKRHRQPLSVKAN